MSDFEIEIVDEAQDASARLAGETLISVEWETATTLLLKFTNDKQLRLRAELVILEVHE